MRKQRKPYVCTKRGKLYYRLRWSEGTKRRERYISLPEPENSEEFDRKYWEIHSGRAPELTKAPARSWEMLIRSYRAAHNYRKLKPGTKRKYNPVIEDIRERNGDKDVRKVTRAQIRAIHEKHSDTPRAADTKLQVIRILLNFARNDLDWIEANPAEEIRLFGPQKEYQPWPEAAQKAFVNACAAAGDDVMLTAFYLGTGTSQRPGDLCTMEWAHYDGDTIAVVQDKTDARIWVACPEFLHKHLRSTPRRGDFILAKNLRQPLGYDAIERRFRAVRALAETQCAGLVMHGWRYTAAVALAEAGCSDAEIQSVTGHKTLAMVQKYRRQASQKRLSKQAQARRGS